MPFNLKHCLVIGLGVGAVAYGMHVSSPDQPVVFQAPSGEFKPLSTFEELAAPKASLIEIDPSVLLELSENFPDLNSQVTFKTDTAAEQESDNDFVAPESAQASETEPNLSLEAVNQFAAPAESQTTTESTGNENLADDFTNNATQNGAEVAVPEFLRHHQRPNSRWKGNPFLGQSQDVSPRISGSLDTMQPAEVQSVENNNFPSDATETDNVVETDNTFETENAIDTGMAAESDSWIETESTQPTIDNASPTPVDLGMRSMQSPARPVNQIPTPMDQDQGFAPLQIQLTEAVILRSTHHIEYGKSLTRRGAAFAGRQEFFSALQVIAQSNDEITGSNDFSVALAQAVVAMKEAKDFINPDAESEVVMEVGTIVETHQSNVLNQSQAKSLTPNQAMQRYLSFARQKLDQAGGRNVVTSEALYCLGKLHTDIAQKHSALSSMDTANAIVFHQAALLSDHKNFRSANELGVLMARTGQLKKATSLFKQSLTVQPTPNTWRNLAKTHRRLGEQHLAQLAETEFAIAAQRRVNGSTAGIRWMPPSDFNAEAPMEYDARVASNPAAAADASMNRAKPVEKPKNKSLGERIKDLF